MSTTNLVHWKEVRVTGNRLSKLVEPLMLTSDGYTCLRQLKLAGEREREWIEVIYDRDYVLEKLIFEYINRLNLPLEQLIQLITDAWNYRNSMNSEVQS